MKLNFGIFSKIQGNVCSEKLLFLKVFKIRDFYNFTLQNKIY